MQLTGADVSETTSPPPPRSEALLRSVMVGLGLGTLIGGAYLAFLGWRTFAYELDCSQLSPNECALQAEAFLYLARRQSMGGLALMVIGLGCFLLLRNRGKSRG